MADYREASSDDQDGSRIGLDQDYISRRAFAQMMGASLAGAALGACGGPQPRLPEAGVQQESLFGCRTPSKARKFYEFDVPHVEPAVIEQIFSRHLRPVRTTNSLWPADTKLLDLIRRTLTDIPLGGPRYTIPVLGDSVFQGSCRALGINTYLVRLSDASLIREIVTKSKVHSEVQRKFGNNLDRIEYVGGVFVLNRGYRFSHNSPSIAPLFLDEWYHLDVYVRRCNVIMPLFRVYFDSLHFWMTRRDFWTPAQFTSETVDSYAFPDVGTIFMDWHRFAATYSLHDHLFYIRAKSRSWDLADATMELDRVLKVGHPIIFSRTATPQAYANADAGGTLVPVTGPYVVHYRTGPGMSQMRQAIVNDIARYAYPEVTTESGVFESHLQAVYSSNVFYAGNSLIAVRLSDAFHSAIHEGVRTSPPTITTKEDPEKAQQAANAPSLEWMGGDWAGDLIRQERYYSEERIDRRQQIPQWGQQCKEATGTYAECKQCLLDGPVGAELEDMKGDRNWDMAGDALGGAAHGCVAGAFVGGWIGCAIGAAAGLVVGLVQSYMENERLIGEAKEEYYSYCE